MAYDANANYQQLINDENAKGTAASTSYLAQLESARNEKIAAMNTAGTNSGGYTATNNYSGYSDPNNSKSASMSAGNDGNIGYGGGSNSGGGASSSYVPLGRYNDAGLSKDDYAAVQSLKYQYEQAMARGDTAAAQAAHAQAEKIRLPYGYSTTDGSDKIPLETESGIQKQGLQSATSQQALIDQLYAAQRQAALQNLKTAYDSNMQDVDAAQAKIAPLYQAQRNQTASAAAVNQANFNERAAASGLNTGAGSQAALSMANQLTGNINTLNSKEAEANTDIETQRLKLQTQYNNAIAQALADNDTQRAQALYNEAIRVDNSLVETSANQAQLNNAYSQLVNQYKQQQLENLRSTAEKAAAWGDFSYYKQLGMSDDTIALLQQRWINQNPLLAYGVTLNYSTSGRSTGRKSTGSGSNISTYTPTNQSAAGATADSDSNLRWLDQKLSAIEDSGSNVSSKAANIIKQYLNSGSISEATAAKYLSQYGL